MPQFEASQGYIVGPCLKNQTNGKGFFSGFGCGKFTAVKDCDIPKSLTDTQGHLKTGAPRGLRPIWGLVNSWRFSCAEDEAQCGLGKCSVTEL